MDRNATFKSGSNGHGVLIEKPRQTDFQRRSRHHPTRRWWRVIPWKGIGGGVSILGAGAPFNPKNPVGWGFFCPYPDFLWSPWAPSPPPAVGTGREAMAYVFLY